MEGRSKLFITETHHFMRRVEELIGLSRDHHHALLLCWKLRKGMQDQVAHERVKLYVNWFWVNHLASHFRIEEEVIFIILKEDDPLRKQALAEHRILEGLFKSAEKSSAYFSELERALEQHIRFEERILFQKIQECATVDQLEKIKGAHKEENHDEWGDRFWIK